MMKLVRAFGVMGFVSVAACLWSIPAFPQAPTKLTFITHAAFFSKETKQPKELDPQVFVRDASAQAGKGPQGIDHVAGYRPALLSDSADSGLFNAKGQRLDGLTLGKWLGAKGEVTITPLKAGGAKVVATFGGLRPGAVYSLFENHFDQQPIGFTPLDGTGSKNSFVVKHDGTATITVTAPQVPTNANAVLLVYHSDGKTHGASRGDIGVSAHHHLIAKLP